MTSLREELGARPRTATPYTMMCPPGWRRVAPSDVADGAAAQSALDAMKSAGRPDLVLQVRGMLSRYRAAVRASNAFDAYLAPLIDGVPIPASMIVAPLVLPPGVSWDQALHRLSRGADVVPFDVPQTPMWTWRRNERVADDGASLTASVDHFVVPVPEENPTRALHFQYTVLATDDPQLVIDFEPLHALGELMMATMRWLPVSDAAGAAPIPSV